MTKALLTSPTLAMAKLARDVSARTAALETCEDYFIARCMIDGDPRQPQPNAETLMLLVVREALGRRA